MDERLREAVWGVADLAAFPNGYEEMDDDAKQRAEDLRDLIENRILDVIADAEAVHDA